VIGKHDVTYRAAMGRRAFGLVVTLALLVVAPCAASAHPGGGSNGDRAGAPASLVHHATLAHAPAVTGSARHRRIPHSGSSYAVVGPVAGVAPTEARVAAVAVVAASSVLTPRPARSRAPPTVV
jgi:hypothetical protein